MPPVLFLSFLLPQRETALFFGLLLLPREHFLLLFGCIPLELQSLLRFCADPAGGGLLAQHSPFPFGIDCLRPNGDGDRWTEFELTIVLQDEVPYLAVFRLCTECDPADRAPRSIRSNTPTQNGGSKHTVRLKKWMSITKPS